MVVDVLREDALAWGPGCSRAVVGEDDQRDVREVPLPSQATRPGIDVRVVLDVVLARVARHVLVPVKNVVLHGRLGWISLPIDAPQ